MGYQADRERFFQQLTHHFPAATYHDARTLLRNASGEMRWNEIASSIDIGEKRTAQEEKKSAARVARVRAICARIGADLEEQGDPRGYPFIIRPVADQGKGSGIYIPGRGLPASAFR